jgi:hypothetical protein
MAKYAGGDYFLEDAVDVECHIVGKTGIKELLKSISRLHACNSKD